MLKKLAKYKNGETSLVKNATVVIKDPEMRIEYESDTGEYAGGLADPSRIAHR